jgi:SAM-dependent methyltransferase
MAGARPGYDQLFRPTFDDAAAYDRFMGRFSVLLAPQVVDAAGIASGGQALDVGCGTGALASELARRLGPESVWALDPSDPFVTATRDRLPGVSVHLGVGEALPFDDRAFDATLALLALSFLDDGPKGIAEMARVTCSGGVVAVCDWVRRGETPTQPFWRGVRRLSQDPAGQRRSSRPGKPLVTLFRELGLLEVEAFRTTATVRYERFEEWWVPITEGVGPAATYARQLGLEKKERLRSSCEAELSSGPFEIEGVAEGARAVVP